MIHFGYMKHGVLMVDNFWSEPREFDVERVNRCKKFTYLTQEEYVTQKAFYEDFYNRAKAYMDNIYQNKIQNSNVGEFYSILNLLDECVEYRNAFGLAMALNVRDRTLQAEQEKRKTKKKEFKIKKVYKGC